MSHRRDRQANFGDINIYAYANAKVGGRKGRLSKAVGPPIEKEVLRLSQGRGERWEQRLEAQDGEADDTGEEPGPGPGQESAGTGATAADEPLVYLELPQDIWFAIGDHISPDEVQTFASICTSSRKVTKSARFWFSMYRRHYSKCELKSLPDRLKPNAMVRLQGLRACVIRTLFFVFPPFVERLRPSAGSSCSHPDLRPLLRRKCVSTWYTNVQSGKYWTFWFKLKRLDPRFGRNCSRSSSEHPTLFQISTDIFANEEKDCKVLQVSCPHYLPLPAVQGHVLTRAQSSVSQDMMANKLSLHFSSDVYIVLDPASSVQVLDWWHPHYPYPAHAPYGANRRLSIYKQIEDFQSEGQDDWYSYR